MLARLLLLFPLLFVLSCEGIEDLGNINGSTEEARYAIPLVDSNAEMDDLLEGLADSALVQVSPDGQLSLLYRQHVLDEGSEALFAVITRYLPILVPVLSPNQELPFSRPGQLELDRADLNGGDFSYFFQWTQPYAAEVVITIAQVQRDGEPLRFTHSLAAASTSQPQTVINRLAGSQLAGYSVVPKDGSIFIEYNAEMENGGTAELDNFVFRIAELDIQYAEGYLAPLRYTAPAGSIPINIYNNWTLGSIFFEEPKATLLVQNSIGVPVRVLFEDFKVVTIDGQTLPLEGPAINSGIDFGYPGIDQAGQSVSSEFVLDSDNSNLEEVLSSQPVRIEYEIDALTNPDGDNSIRGFIADTSSFHADLELEIPLYGKVQDFVLRDTADIDFSLYEEIDHGEFKSITDNELPLNVKLQAFFLDGSGIVLDSLYESPRLLIKAAPVDDNGIASGETREITYTTLTGGRFEKIRDARQLVLEIRFDSPSENGSPSVRLLADRQVRIRIGAILGYDGN